MTKNWETYGREIIRLYEQHTLDEVMDIMRVRRGFVASRRSYNQFFSKWGVRKYKRKGRDLVVHDPCPNRDGDTGRAQQVDEAAGGKRAESSTRQAQLPSGQSLVQPHLSEAPHSQLTDHRHQHEAYPATQDWEYFDNAWPVPETSMQEYEPSMESTQQ